MSRSENDPPWAFRSVRPTPASGMTLRDYFAAKAMVPLMHEGYPAANAARFAYEYADAMLKEREK